MRPAILFLVGACGVSTVQGAPETTQWVAFPDQTRTCTLLAACGDQITKAECLRTLPKVRVPPACANAVTAATTCEALTATDLTCSPSCDALEPQCLDAHTLGYCEESGGRRAWVALGCPTACDAARGVCE